MHQLHAEDAPVYAVGEVKYALHCLLLAGHAIQCRLAGLCRAHHLKCMTPCQHGMYAAVPQDSSTLHWQVLAVHGNARLHTPRLLLAVRSCVGYCVCSPHACCVSSWYLLSLLGGRLSGWVGWGTSCRCTSSDGSSSALPAGKQTISRSNINRLQPASDLAGPLAV